MNTFFFNETRNFWILPRTRFLNKIPRHGISVSSGRLAVSFLAVDVIQSLSSTRHNRRWGEKKFDSAVIPRVMYRVSRASRDLISGQTETHDVRTPLNIHNSCKRNPIACLVRHNGRPLPRANAWIIYGVNYNALLPLPSASFCQMTKFLIADRQIRGQVYAL